MPGWEGRRKLHIRPRDAVLRMRIGGFRPAHTMQGRVLTQEKGSDGMSGIVLGGQEGKKWRRYGRVQGKAIGNMGLDYGVLLDLTRLGQ